MGWYTFEEENAWCDMEYALAESLEKEWVKERTRKLIWRRAKKATQLMSRRQSIDNLHRLHPQYPIEEVQGCLISWMEECAGPKNCTQEQMDSFD